ncbi:uncharacterized protein N7511_010918 [Penicillium nucicola]|uniref:uncharacterized protein n=1 Tax=Penicillium nucicola TaxID=1850975 RepID=UPI002545249C|nr:uncharacterized protein N7511_010918 [Penicillium nucicola]KAJ5749222.1 hypothetical protein N7511_010918 [Penicillium nucicola]
MAALTNAPASWNYTVWDRTVQFDAPTLRPLTTLTTAEIESFDFGFHQPEPVQSVQSPQTQAEKDVDMDHATRGIALINTWVHPALPDETIQNWQNDGLLPENLPIVAVPEFEVPAISIPIGVNSLITAPNLSPSSILRASMSSPFRQILQLHEPQFDPSYGQSSNDCTTDDLEKRLIHTQRSASLVALQGSPVTPISAANRSPVTPGNSPPWRNHTYLPRRGMSDNPGTPRRSPVANFDSTSSGLSGEMNDSPTNNIVRSVPIEPPCQLSPSSTQSAVSGTSLELPERNLLPPFSPSGLNLDESRSSSSMEDITESEEEGPVGMTEWTSEMWEIMADDTPRSHEERRNAFGPECNPGRCNWASQAQESVPVPVPPRSNRDRVRRALRRVTQGVRHQ